VIAGHVHDLASECAARFRTIKSDVVGSLDDCTLSAAAVAARHRVTPRYVHKLLESKGATFTRFLTERRLDRAYRMLREELPVQRSGGHTGPKMGGTIERDRSAHGAYRVPIQTSNSRAAPIHLPSIQMLRPPNRC